MCRRLPSPDAIMSGTSNDMRALARNFDIGVLFNRMMKSVLSPSALFHEIEGPGGVKTKCDACGAKVGALEFHLCSQMAIRTVNASFAKLRAPVASVI